MSVSSAESLNTSNCGFKENFLFIFQDKFQEKKQYTIAKTKM